MDVVALAREHPLFPQLGRLEYLADRIQAGELPLSEATDLALSAARPTGPLPAGAEKDEAEPAPQGSKGQVRGAAARGEPARGTSMVPARVEAELAAIREQAAAAARERTEAGLAAGPPRPGGLPAAAPRGDLEARARAAAGLRAEARRLAAIIRQETAIACRRLAAEHDLRVHLGDQREPPADLPAPDRTEVFRQWLRAHWQP